MVSQASGPSGALIIFSTLLCLPASRHVSTIFLSKGIVGFLESDTLVTGCGETSDLSSVTEC